MSLFVAWIACGCQRSLGPQAARLEIEADKTIALADQLGISVLSC